MLSSWQLVHLRQPVLLHAGDVTPTACWPKRNMNTSHVRTAEGWRGGTSPHWSSVSQTSGVRGVIPGVTTKAK